jgi:CHAD domain-containing protein
LDPSLSTKRAARRAVVDRLGVVARRIRPALRAGADEPEGVHRLRIATRRAGAALALFEPCFRGRDLDRIRKLLRGLRRAAAAVRDADVQAELWRGVAEEEPGLAPLLVPVLEHLGESRSAANALLRARAAGPGRVRRAARRAARGARGARIGGERAADLATLAGWRIAELTEALRSRVEGGLAEPEDLHEARIAVKRLRYTLELLGGGLQTDSGALVERVRAAHARLGDHQDLVVAQGLIASMAACGALGDEAAAALGAAIERRRRAAELAARESLGWLIGGVDGDRRRAPAA